MRCTRNSLCPGTIVGLTRKEYKQAFFISFVASCLETIREDPIRELQIKALGRDTYDYIISYLSRKGLYPPKPFIRSVDDWFRYSWLWLANIEPMVHWVGKRVNELVSLGVPPDKITLAGKWVFDVKVKKGSRWVTVAHRDPTITTGLPYWIGFNQVYGGSTTLWGCPGNPPKSWTTSGLCTTCTLNNNVFGIYFAGGGKPPSNIQAGVGVNCCYGTTGYNMNSPSTTFNVSVDSTGTKNVSTWTITGITTVSVSGPYLVLLMSNNGGGSGYGLITGFCNGACTGLCCSTAGACGCASTYYVNPVFEFIYENLGTLNIASNTTITASIQLIIAISSPG
ncbi:MAG: hypothetical protein RXR18_05635 [Nitrososphaeria archaeon]